ncbi:putative bifunctional diguanylate cyclase/phosphodiesterase [Sphingomonas fuzhouensis]|uniref:putative bifunctional diguanylate cyclase/phosphodiesterase n=1 Tax=Sphingomonas fuzhouensis TaxID=3106033 RepID=UPI002AFDF705|nr:GGDEF domain-containing phosphodiesterase [Sphingomonas sp. SGZ-02]
MTQDEFGFNAHRRGTAIFALSFHHPAMLDEAIIRGGWAIWSMAPRDGEPPAGDVLVGSFLASEARVAFIDARGSSDAGLRAAQALGAVIAATGAAMLVAIPDSEPETFDAFLAAGVTHILAPDADDAMLHASLKLAERHARRTLDVRRRRTHADGEVGEIHRWIADALDRGDPCVAVVVALSRLDLINAAHGRPAGNMLLRGVEVRMQAAAAEAFGDRAIVARSGGAEFVMAGVADGRDARAIAETLEALLAQPFQAGAVPIRLGVRLGLSESRQHEDPANLLARAGEALAQAQASDGAMLRFAHPGDVAPLDVLAADLHHAIERGEIDIVFQPQVAIKTGRITGVEALARWRHPTLGPLGADPLFAAAERADLGLALSDHIQQIALQRAARWPGTLSHLRLSINITAADVGRAGFARIFLDRVAASGFPIERLTVEITETGLIRELDRAAAVLDTLRDAGIRVAIDDFGTGYSSLAYLTSLPIDYLKLDRALVTEVDGSRRDRVVVRGIIRIAAHLGMGIVAEGVETQEQAALLGRLGCETYQGFLCAAPLDEMALRAMVEGELECAA